MPMWNWGRRYASAAAPLLTWDAANKSSAFSPLPPDALTATTSTAGFQSIISTLPKTSGLRYFETKGTTLLFANQLGIINSADALTFTPGNGINGICTNCSFVDSRGASGSGTAGGGTFATSGTPLTPAWVLGDIVSGAVNIDTGNMWLAINNVWTVFRSGGTSDPNTQTDPVFTFPANTSVVVAAAIAGNGGTADMVIAGSGTSLNGYSPPTGFSWWNT